MSGVNGDNPVFDVSNASLEIIDNVGKGNITSDEYGIMASNSGTVILTGGTVVSKYAALCGNNTTGDMNFVVNGGVLTSRLSEAIYMSGQQKLTITSGTINGGISARMGQIYISGGTINGMTEDQASDSFDQYWNYSGSAWIGDAIYVWGGTYNSTNTTYGNSCNINITGGTINGNAHNAIAVYNIANNYDQEITISIADETVVNGKIVEDSTKFQNKKNVVIDWGDLMDVTKIINVSNDTDFSSALKMNGNTIVNLSSDVSYNITPWIHGTGTMGGESTKTVTINGNGHTLTFNNINNDWNGIFIANEDATLTINNTHLTNSGYNDGPWNRHDINFHCKVVLNEVTSDKPIAVKKDSTLNKVNISYGRAKDDYLLWIQACGETVNVIDCRLFNKKDTGTTRGIKIADQYVDSPTPVVLNVSGTTFDTTKKAAVLVTSTAGANIVWDTGNDISKVTDDQTNAVWNDADTTAAWDLVTVTGCTKYQEQQ